MNEQMGALARTRMKRRARDVQLSFMHLSASVLTRQDWNFPTIRLAAVLSEAQCKSVHFRVSVEQVLAFVHRSSGICS